MKENVEKVISFQTPAFALVVKIVNTNMTTVVEFHREAVEINGLLHSNEHPERICLYLVRQLDYELSKVGYFQISKSIFEIECKFSFLKLIFSFEY